MELEVHGLDWVDKELDRIGEFLKIKPVWYDLKKHTFSWIDTRLIPWEERTHETSDYRRVARAIKDMEIRGAPAIGVSAAFGLALAVVHSNAKSLEELLAHAREAKETLASTRPTAYNLFWALDRVWNRIAGADDVDDARFKALDEAWRIYIEDVKGNIEMGRHGSRLIEDGDTIMTHCNTGALATAGFGTALGVIRYAWYEGKRISVVTTETRPVLQGARLNVWELRKEGIPFKVIVDGAAGIILREGKADKVIVGADRIILTGHTANKIGTYMVALAAWHNQKPFYVAAPTSTFQENDDPRSIVIEERDPEEVRTIMGRFRILSEDVKVYNPSFDVTPPELITAFITEKGIVNPPYRENIRKILG